MERCQEQAIRASAIISRFRDFITRRDSEKALNDVHETLNNAIRLATVGIDAEPPIIEVRCDAAASTAFFDRIQIEQVVFNLVRNAIEAMANSARRVLTIRTKVNADDMVEVSVADTGPGLAPDIRSRLFEPFVTSKAGRSWNWALYLPRHYRGTWWSAQCGRQPWGWNGVSLYSSASSRDRLT